MSPNRVLIAVCCLTMVCGCGDRDSLVKDSPIPRTKLETAKSDRTESTADIANGDEKTLVETPTPQEESDRTRSAPVAAVEKAVAVISFDDLNLGMPEDSMFRERMLSYNDGRAKELLGKVINIGGQMSPPDQLKDLNEFVLLKNKDCKFGPGGQADHLIRVFMPPGKVVDYTDKVIYIEGRLTLNPFPVDGPSTWAIYDVEATNVTSKAPARDRR